MFAILKKSVEKVLGRARADEPALVTSPSYADVFARFNEFREHTPIPDGLLQRLYPPPDQGLPVRISTQDLLAKHTRLISTIEQTMMLPSDEFKWLILPIIARFARHVHLLPASEANHHRGPGGLLHHSLEVAFNAVRGTHFTSFTRDVVISKRREVDRRWQVAAFIAGLFHDIGKTWWDMTVTDEAGENEWRPTYESLADWSKRTGAEEYFVRWRPKRGTQHQGLNSSLMMAMRTRELDFWMTDFGGEAFRRVVRTLNYEEPDHPFAQLIARADSTSVADDLSTRAQNGVALAGGWGAGLGAQIADSISGLISAGKWTVNERGARIWVLQDAVYIVWKHAYEEVRQILKDEGLRMLPKHPDTAAEELFNEGLAEPRMVGEDKHIYWDVAPESLAADDGKLIWLRCLKLKSPGLIFRSITPPVPALATIGKPTDPKAPTLGPIPQPEGITLEISPQVTEPASEQEGAVDLDAVISAATLPAAKQKKTAKGSPAIKQVPVSIDEIIGDISAPATSPATAPTPKTQVSTPAAAEPKVQSPVLAPMFALDGDDDLFGSSAPKAAAPTLPPVNVAPVPMSVPAPTPIVQPTEKPPVTAVAEKPVEQATKAPQVDSPIHAKFGKEPVVAAAIQSAVDRGNFWIDEAGRAFLPLSASNFDKSAEAALVRSGWIWRNPMRVGQVTTSLAGHVGHTFESLATSVIVKAHNGVALRSHGAAPQKKPKDAKPARAQSDAPIAAAPVAPLFNVPTIDIDPDVKLSSDEGDQVLSSLPAGAESSDERIHQEPSVSSKRTRTTKRDQMAEAVKIVVSEIATDSEESPDTLYVSTRKLMPILSERELTKAGFIKSLERQGYFVKPHLRGLIFSKKERA